MKFTVPTRVILGKKKKTSYPLNANTFANFHHRQKHNAKMMVYEYIKDLRLYDRNKGSLQTPIRLHLEYYTERKPNFDIDNVLFGIHKFTADALVNCGLIVDDTYKHVLCPTFKYMGVDKDHHFKGYDHLRGRCDIEIEEIRSSKPPSWWR